MPVLRFTTENIMTFLRLTSELTSTEKINWLTALPGKPTRCVISTSGGSIGVVDGTNNTARINTQNLQPQQPLGVIVVSPDGLHLVTSDNNGFVKLYQTADARQPMWQRQKSDRKINCLTFCYADTFLSACTAGAIRAWNTVTGKSRLLGHDNAYIRALCVIHLAQQSYIVSGSQSGMLRIRDMDANRRAELCLTEAITACCQLQNEMLAVAVGSEIGVYHLHQKQDLDIELQQITSITETSVVMGLDFCAQFNHVLYTTAQGSIKIWNQLHDRLESTLNVTSGCVRSLFLSTDIMVCWSSHKVMFYDTVHIPMAWYAIIKANNWQQLRHEMQIWRQNLNWISLQDILSAMTETFGLSASEIMMLSLLLTDTAEIDAVSRMTLMNSFCNQIGACISMYHAVSRQSLNVMNVRELSMMFAEAQLPDISRCIQHSNVTGSDFKFIVCHLLQKFDLVTRACAYTTLRRVCVKGRLPRSDARYLDALSPEMLYQILVQHKSMQSSETPRILLENRINGTCLTGLVADAKSLGIDYQHLMQVVTEIENQRLARLTPYRNKVTLALPETPKVAVCPLCLGCMSEPVLAPDGYHYDRIWIAAWNQEYHCSPMTDEAWLQPVFVPQVCLHKTITIINHHVNQPLILE